MAETPVITSEIVEHLGVLSVNGKWKKEINIVKWGDNAPKYDIRPWNEDHSKASKGLTFTGDELTELRRILDGIDELNG